MQANKTEQLLSGLSLPNSRNLMKRQNLKLAGLLTRWPPHHMLCHIHQMEAGRIPKDILYGELASGKGTVGHPEWRYTNACKRHTGALGISTKHCKTLHMTAADGDASFRTSSVMVRRKSSVILQHKLRNSEQKILSHAKQKWNRRKVQRPTKQPECGHKGGHCSKDCHSCSHSESQTNSSLHYPWSFSTDRSLLLLSIVCAIILNAVCQY